MSNFFNAIGVADMEKVHSAVIGWMLSNNCNAFGIKEKSYILCQLFKQPTRPFNTIDVHVEVYDIDILIETEDGQGQKECWVIENKVKSNQHDNQLDKYVSIIGGVYNNVVPVTNQHYCFLTLIQETPKGTYANIWNNCRYHEFHKVLTNYFNSMNNHVHSEIIKEYASCIFEMTDVLDDFLKTPDNYPNVFSDGSKKKVQKDITAIGKCKGGQKAIYIAECGLETIFQKCYMGKVASGIYYPYEIKETRGNAMLNIDVTKKIIWNSVKAKYPDNTIQAGIEFQNGTLKIQIHDMDNKNGIKNNFNNNWVRAFEIAFKSSQNINPSKKDSRYYVSKTLWKKSDWWNNAINWDNTIQDCIQKLQTAVNCHP